MPRPVSVWIFLRSDLLAGVADKERLVSLRDRFKSEVVVNAAVAQDGGLGVGLLVEIGARSVDDRLLDLEFGRRKYRREGGRRRNRRGERYVRAFDQPDTVVAHVIARETPECSRLDVRRVDDKAWISRLRIVGQCVQFGALE